MFKFLLNNILSSIINIFILISFTFLLLDILPTDPVKVRLGIRYNEKDAKILREKYQLDKPLPHRFLTYIFNLLSGDFGTSIITGYDVLFLVKNKTPNSLKLILLSLIFSLPFAPIALFLGYSNKGIKIERFLFFIAIIPAFIVSSIIIFISITLFQISLTSEKMHITDFIIPSAILSLFPSFIIFKTIRENTQKTSTQLFITAHKAFGFPKKDILLKFIPKNISPQTISLLSNLILYYLSTIYVLEFTFGINGVGELAVSSALNYDFPVVISIAVLTSIIYNFVNILTKILILITNRAFIHESAQL
jgi:ABC-type dipeptide/oligopeptide/nickel transport system permease component